MKVDRHSVNVQFPFKAKKYYLKTTMIAFTVPEKLAVTFSMLLLNLFEDGV